MLAPDICRSASARTHLYEFAYRIAVVAAGAMMMLTALG